MPVARSGSNLSWPKHERRSGFDWEVLPHAGLALGTVRTFANVFLDGNTYADSHLVDSKPLVADLSAGVAMNYKNTKVAYALVYRTKEFKGQNEGQTLGTVSLNWIF
jgi:hypothetical protein